MYYDIILIFKASTANTNFVQILTKYFTPLTLPNDGHFDDQPKSYLLSEKVLSLEN